MTTLCELPVSQLPPYPLCKPPIQSLCFQLVQEESVGNSYLELGQVSSRQDSKVFKSRTGSCLSSASSSQPHSMSLPICLVPVCQRGWEQQDGAWQPFSICVCCSVLVLEVGQEVQWPWMPLGVHSHAQANPREDPWGPVQECRRNNIAPELEGRAVHSCL